MSASQKSLVASFLNGILAAGLLVAAVIGGAV